MSNDQSRRPIVIFRWLTPFNLAAALFLRAIGRRVTYIEPVGWLRSWPWVSRLRPIGIERADFHTCRNMPVSQDIKFTALYGNRIIDEIFSADDLAQLFDLAQNLPDSERAPRTILFGVIVLSILPMAQAYGLAEYHRSRGTPSAVYHPFDLIGMLLNASEVSPVANYAPSLGVRAVTGLLDWAPGRAIASAILGIASWTLSIFPRRDRASANAEARAITEAAIGNADVLYFPHKGVAYGDLYLKDQYYVENPESPFHKSRIRHLEMRWLLDPGDSDFISENYKHLGIEPVYLEQTKHHSLASTLRVFRAVVKSRRGKLALSKSLAMTAALVRFQNFRESLSPCRSAKIALIGYDSLFPAMAALALQSFGVKVVGTQERFIHSFYGIYPYAFDLFFVHGSIAKARIAEDPNTDIRDICVIGDARRQKLKAFRTLAAEKRQIEYSEFKSVCLILDFQTKTDPFSNSFFYWTDPQSNILFYNHIWDLADANPDTVFILRGKNTDWLSIPAMAAVRGQLESLPNLVIDTDYDQFERTYLLAAMADIVVARHSSLCDQCLAEGIPVLIHEALPNGRKMISWLHDYAPYPIMTHDSEELRRRFSETVREGSYMAPDMLRQLQKDYFAVDPAHEITPKERLDQALEALLHEARAERTLSE